MDGAERAPRDRSLGGGDTTLARGEGHCVAACSGETAHEAANRRSTTRAVLAGWLAPLTSA